MSNLSSSGRFKPYEELEFRDDFMFGKVMEDSELCRDVLECLLQQPVGELRDIDPQREFRYSEEGKPIRLDIYTRDEDRVYDAEMQNQNNESLENLELPKRSRFYQSSIDTDCMNKNYSYRKLPESAILFICTFDPFEKGLSQYTFKEKCEEDGSISLKDGTKKIFYNCTYKGDDIPEDKKQLYNYIENGKTKSELTKRIDSSVKEARKREEWKSDYMKERVIIMDAIEAERERAEKAEDRAEKAKGRAEKERARADSAEAELARYKEKYGVLA